MNCDYVSINGSDGKPIYATKITGPASASDKHWPGVNVPFVRVEGDNCVINFKSDGGTVRCPNENI